MNNNNNEMIAKGGHALTNDLADQPASQAIQPKRESAIEECNTHIKYLGWKPTNGRPEVNNWDKHDVETPSLLPK